MHGLLLAAALQQSAASCWVVARGKLALDSEDSLYTVLVTTSPALFGPLPHNHAALDDTHRPRAEGAGAFMMCAAFRLPFGGRGKLKLIPSD